MTIETDERRITLKHGDGGRAMRGLISDVLTRGFAETPFDGFGLEAMDDGAAIRFGNKWLILTTDSHVIHPIFFPGGDIGRLSICGTVNDLAMMGATESIFLSSAMIFEESFPIAQVEAIQKSMLDACREAGAIIVTGDTKVMGRGELDGMIINTTGIGITDEPIRDKGLRPGDRIIVTGTMGDHGLAVMAARHDLDLSGELLSDVAPLTSMIRAALHAAQGGIIAMKDPTRGGLSSALHEMAAKGKVGIVIEERKVPVSDAARAAGELLGIDPFQVANEGKAVIGVHRAIAEEVLEVLRRTPTGRDAAIVGSAVAERPGSVILDTGYGRRLLAESDGEPLPRIC